MRRKLTAYALLVLLILSFGISASAQAYDGNRTGSMTITLLDPQDQKPITGAIFDLYHVAEVGINTDGNLNYIYTTSFSNCGIELTDPDLAPKLAEFVKKQTIGCRRIATNANGAATATNLTLGMYLVVQYQAAQGYSACSPFLVMIPSQNGSDFTYNVNATPKTDVTKLVDITINKVWNTGKTSQIPGSVTIRLYRDGETVSNHILNKDNNWQIVIKNLPRSDGYSIEEMNVPQGYTATYSQSGYTFTVTNTSSLAQTGQLVWPIPVLAAAGLFFLVLGAALLRKSGKDYA